MTRSLLLLALLLGASAGSLAFGESPRLFPLGFAGQALDALKPRF
jgi:hypothetical protein